MSKINLLVISATNRPGANTKIISDLAMSELAKQSDVNVQLLNLADLKSDIFNPACYGEKPDWFIENFQKPILSAQGALVVTPEYNGGFPGVMKYFIDMLKFPESLVGLPTAFIGCAAGQWGALRSVEQLEILFQYRSAHIFGERLFIPALGQNLHDGQLVGDYKARLESLTANFTDFCRALVKN